MPKAITRHAQSGPCHCTALRKASRRVSQLYDAVLAAGGLKATQRAILAELRRTGPATVGGLAAALVMDAGALAHTLKPLARDGLVAVTVDPADRRHRRVSLTAAGHRCLRKSDALLAKAQRGFEAALGRTRARALRQAMQTLVSDDFLRAFEKSAAVR